MLSMSMQALMGAADNRCKADHGQRSPERTNSRDGYRPRQLDTWAGAIELAVPTSVGNVLPGPAAGAPQGCRAGADSVVATYYLPGVSTHRVDQLVQSSRPNSARDTAALWLS